jgi:hypothetical protein
MRKAMGRPITALALSVVFTLTVLWGLNEGRTPSGSLAQAGTGVIRLATTGTDDPGCGGVASPCRTPQYAAIRADPGDEVRVATGVYAGVQILPRPSSFPSSQRPWPSAAMTRRSSTPSPRPSRPS